MSTINTALGSTATPNYDLNQILQSTKPPSQPGGFRRVLGAVVGGVGNLVAPGIGGMIGNVISGGGGLGGINAASAFNDSMQYLQLQQQMNQQQQLFETASAVLKSRHDASMDAIRNIS